MRSLTRNVLMLALGLGLLAEVACFCGMSATGDDSFLFQSVVGFHRPGLVAAGLLIPELYEDDPNISTIESAIVWGVVVSTALFQWFIIFLGGFQLHRHFGRPKHEIVAA